MGNAEGRKKVGRDIDGVGAGVVVARSIAESC